MNIKQVACIVFVASAAFAASRVYCAAGMKCAARSGQQVQLNLRNIEGDINYTPFISKTASLSSIKEEVGRIFNIPVAEVEFSVMRQWYPKDQYGNELEQRIRVTLDDDEPLQDIEMLRESEVITVTRKERRRDESNFGDLFNKMGTLNRY